MEAHTRRKYTNDYHYLKQIRDNSGRDNLNYSIESNIFYDQLRGIDVKIETEMSELREANKNREYAS